jgi:hypothetical protein
MYDSKDLPKLKGHSSSGELSRLNILKRLNKVFVSPGPIPGTWIVDSDAVAKPGEFESPDLLHGYIIAHDSTRPYTKKETEAFIYNQTKKLMDKQTNSNWWSEWAGENLSTFVFADMVDTLLIQTKKNGWPIHVKTFYPEVGDYICLSDSFNDYPNQKAVITKLDEQPGMVYAKTKTKQIYFGIFSGQLKWIIRKNNDIGWLEI